MTEPIKDGGPAFPIFNDSDFNGMSLRDAFAISAMHALMPIYWEHVDDYEDGVSLVKCHAETAYEYADAMLRARSQGEQE